MECKKGSLSALCGAVIGWFTTAKYCGSKFGNEVTGGHAPLPRHCKFGKIYVVRRSGGRRRERRRPRGGSRRVVGFLIGLPCAWASTVASKRGPRRGLAAAVVLSGRWAVAIVL